jgi:hypothetical protein
LALFGLLSQLQVWKHIRRPVAGQHAPWGRQNEMAGHPRGIHWELGEGGPGRHCPLAAHTWAPSRCCLGAGPVGSCSPGSVLLGNAKHSTRASTALYKFSFFFEIGSHCVAQADSELRILLLQPAYCWDYRWAPPHLVPSAFFNAVL